MSSWETVAAARLRNKYFDENGLESAYNFAYGAATIPEIHSTYEYLRDNATLKTLIIGVPLRAFGVGHRGDLNRVPEAIRLSNAPLRYYTSWFVAKTGWANIDERYGRIVDQVARFVPELVGAAQADDRSDWALEDLLDPEICVEDCPLPEILDGAGPVERAPYKPGLGLGPWRSIWQRYESLRTLPSAFARQVSKNAANDWRGFRFSEEHWAKIEEIAAWCEREGINLIFFVPPTIVEMQNRIIEFGVASVNQSYRNRLARLAPVVDFDFDSELTRDLGNFTDAYHFNSQIARAIAAELIRQVDPSINVDESKRKGAGLMRCPLGDAGLTSSKAHDGITMREGINCRVWTSAESVVNASKPTREGKHKTGNGYCRVGSKSDV